MPLGVLEELRAEVEQEDARKAEANPAALVLVREQDREREAQVNQKWTERFTRTMKNGRKKSTLRSASWGYRRHSQDGYTAGKAAGAGISYGGARAGIAGSKSRLEGQS